MPAGLPALTRRQFLGRGALGLCALGISIPAAACDDNGAQFPQGRTSPAGSGTGSVSSVTVMGAPRAAHTATALVEGGVLVVGGFGVGEDIPSATAEVYEADTGRFTLVGGMITPRQSHAASALPDGRVLITGGYGPDGPLSSAEVYDPSGRRFFPTGAMYVRRAGHEAVALPDGRVLVVGGVGPDFGFLASAELYDPKEDRFSPTGSMSVPRESHTATLLSGGQVLVAGGHAGGREQLDLYASAELYEPRSDRFLRAADMTMRRHKHDAVRLADGRVLVVGGADAREDPKPFDTAEVYEPTQDRFRRTGALSHARYKLRGTSVLLDDGRVVVAGGADRPEIYEPATDRFSVLSGSYGRAPLFATAAWLAGGAVLLCGGYSRHDPPTDTAWLVRP